MRIYAHDSFLDYFLKEGFFQSFILFLGDKLIMWPERAAQMKVRC